MGHILKRHPRLLVAVLTAVATAGIAMAQQATVVGTLEGHTDPVYAIAWSPDGKTLATASFDNTIRLWDAFTRKEIKKYEGHAKLALAVSISPDSKHILSGGQDNTAKIWDYPTSGPTKTFEGHPAAVAALAIKPDGKQFAAAAGKSVKVWDPHSGKATKDLEGHAADISSIAWRGDGGQLATGDKANTIRLWKADLTPDSVIECPSPAVQGLGYLPNNQQLVSAGSDGIARLWQLPAAVPRRFEAKGLVAAAAIPAKSQPRVPIRLSASGT
jgi:WD40 repeat protein